MLARQVSLTLEIEGTDVTDSVWKKISTWTYTDNLDKLDELSIGFNGDKFIKEWSFKKGEKIKADIEVLNWNKEDDNRKLNCGSFYVDSDSFAGPPDVTTIGAISVDISRNVKNQKKDQVWENITLEKIAKEKATENNLGILYDADEVKFDRVEQIQESDSKLLSRIANENGIQMKIINDKFVFFEEETYESNDSSFTFDKDKGLVSYSFSSDDVDTYDKCIVKYTDSTLGETLEGSFTAPDRSGYKIATNRILEKNISGNVPGETSETKISYLNKRAKKYLRSKNKSETSGVITLPGDPKYQAGLIAELKNFGKFDGNYIIDQVVHSSGQGYSCSLKLRKVLGY